MPARMHADASHASSSALESVLRPHAVPAVLAAHRFVVLQPCSRGVVLHVALRGQHEQMHAFSQGLCSHWLIASLPYVSATCRTARGLTLSL
jgi:hypothetical protein